MVPLTTDERIANEAWAATALLHAAYAQTRHTTWWLRERQSLVADPILVPMTPHATTAEVEGALLDAPSTPRTIAAGVQLPWQGLRFIAPAATDLQDGDRLVNMVNPALSVRMVRCHRHVVLDAQVESP